jgi:hypothetical protein
MARNRWRSKGRRESGTFFALPHDVMDSENYKRLSAHAQKLLLDIGRQYNGSNNGDLCCSWSVMKARGWHSKDTLDRARRDLLHHGVIMLTRQGGRGFPSLYALTWQPIDECKGKLEVNATQVAPGDWKEPKPVRTAPPKKNAAPVAVPSRPGSRTFTEYPEAKVS